MIEEIKKDADTRMGKSVEVLKLEFSKVRTGRANAALLDHVSVDYYGSDVPISQAANVAVEDARTLVITPWEPPMVAKIEKAIMNSDLGLNPTTAGAVIRINLPPLTEERRRDLVKVVKNETENARIAIRNIRRDANDKIKKLQHDKEISEDDEHHGYKDVQELTDEYIKRIDELAERKNSEILEF